MSRACTIADTHYEKGNTSFPNPHPACPYYELGRLMSHEGH